MQYKSFDAMAKALILINGFPYGEKTRWTQDKIRREIERYAKISIIQVKEGGNKSVTIEGVYSEQQASLPRRAGQSNISEYLRPILQDMINNEYQYECFYKFHKQLTVDLWYMPDKYRELYEALNKDEFNMNFPFDIENKDNYARYIIKEKLVGRIKGYIKYCCERLDYVGVSTYKIALDFNESDYLSNAEQKLYDNFKLQVKNELEKSKELNPKLKIDYRNIYKKAAKLFNEHKKKLDPNHENMNLFEAWTFEIDEDFKPVPQTTDPKQLNTEILKGFLKSIKYDEIYSYAQSSEYQKIKEENDDYKAKSGFICSDRVVRQALTINNRDKTAQRKGISEKEINLDFSILSLESYINDIIKIKEACKI
jgi:hypothetical protein